MTLHLTLAHRQIDTRILDHSAKPLVLDFGIDGHQLLELQSVDLQVGRVSHLPLIGIVAMSLARSILL